jgi:hypothetical protein
VDVAIQLELEGKQVVAGDLIDHFVGPLLSPEDAGYILQSLLDDKYLSILQGPRGHKTVVDQAVRFAKARGCIRSHEPAPAVKAWLKPGTFKWPLPPSPVEEATFVAFLNAIITRALKALKRAGKSVAGRRQISQFSAVRRQHHALPLSHPDDEADMRPDFVLLPLSAWPPIEPMAPPVSAKGDTHTTKKAKVEKSVERATPGSDLLPAFDCAIPATKSRLERYPLSFATEKYLNFTAFRLVGESKTSDAGTGKKQLKRYLRGFKRAQPWLRYAIGLSYAKGELSLVRCDQSGTEETVLDLSHPGHALDCVRLLAALSIMSDEELGVDPAFELDEKEELLSLKKETEDASGRASSSSNRPPNSRKVKTPTNTAARSGKRKAEEGEAPESAPAIYNMRYIRAFSTNTKKDDVETFTVEGIIHVSGSIRGRGTFAMAGRDVRGSLVAIKRMWGDCAREYQEQDLFCDIEKGIKSMKKKKKARAVYVLRASR